MRLLIVDVIAWAIALLMIILGGVVHADSQDLLDEIVEVYVNATPGQVFETQRRGGITVGSVVARSRVVRPNFISITPPSIRGGCQGMDLIGGSFSFINGEQLQQFLRSIASNALNYAFTCSGCSSSHSRENEPSCGNSINVGCTKKGPRTRT